MKQRSLFSPRCAKCARHACCLSCALLVGRGCLHVSDEARPRTVGVSIPPKAKSFINRIAGAKAPPLSAGNASVEPQPTEMGEASWCKCLIAFVCYSTLVWPRLLATCSALGRRRSKEAINLWLTQRRRGHENKNMLRSFGLQLLTYTSCGDM